MSKVTLLMGFLDLVLVFVIEVCSLGLTSAYLFLIKRFLVFSLIGFLDNFVSLL
jgi:hypothetical protein